MENIFGGENGGWLEPISIAEEWDSGSLIKVRP